MQVFVTASRLAIDCVLFHFIKTGCHLVEALPEHSDRVGLSHCGLRMKPQCHQQGYQANC